MFSLAECRKPVELEPVFGALEPGIGVQGPGSRSTVGGVAGPRGRPPDLAPAQSPLAWPLQPTGGDALIL